MMAPKTQAIPEEIRRLPHWLMWRLEERLDKDTGEIKLTKIPYCPDGRNAQSNNRIPGFHSQRLLVPTIGADSPALAL
jgi:primase-polymerase (primpol)-like protein